MVNKFRVTEAVFVAVLLEDIAEDHQEVVGGEDVPGAAVPFPTSNDLASSLGNPGKFPMFFVVF